MRFCKQAIVSCVEAEMEVGPLLEVVKIIARATREQTDNHDTGHDNH
jgi:hypothetical protein